MSPLRYAIEGILMFLFWLAVAAFFIGGCMSMAHTDRRLADCRQPRIAAYVEIGHDVETARYLARQECNQLHNDGLLP